MTLPVAAVRAHFPALDGGAAHFEGPGGSQTPDVVARAMYDTLVSPIANRGTVTRAERNADAVVQAARAAMADLLGADPNGVVYGRSMTQLTFDFARTLATTWMPGDEVVVSRLDHDANVSPWVIAARAAGASVRWIDFDPDSAELSVEHVAEQLGERTRLVALTGASNLIGTRPDLPAIAELVHRGGALFYVDGVHLSAHAGIDVAALGADFFACSPYKFFGPHCGVVAASPDLLDSLHPAKLRPSSDAVPERFELGTLPYELLAGTTAAVDFIAGLCDLGGEVRTPTGDEMRAETDALAAGAGPATGEPTGERGAGRRERVLSSMGAVAEHEDALRVRLERGLAEIPKITVHSRASQRTPTLLLTFTDRPAHDAYRFLAKLDVNAPAGTFYAAEPARRLGLPEGGLRIGLSPYTDDTDVDRLLDGLTAFVG